MSFPIPIIVSQFEAFYAEQKRGAAAARRKARLLDRKRSEEAERAQELQQFQSRGAVWPEPADTEEDSCPLLSPSR